jgi:hypothetical protein
VRAEASAPACAILKPKEVAISGEIFRASQSKPLSTLSQLSVNAEAEKSIFRVLKLRDVWRSPERVVTVISTRSGEIFVSM